MTTTTIAGTCAHCGREFTREVVPPAPEMTEERIAERRAAGIPLPWEAGSPEVLESEARYARYQRDGFPPHWPNRCETAEEIAERERRVNAMLAAGDRLTQALAQGHRAADADPDIEAD